MSRLDTDLHVKKEFIHTIRKLVIQKIKYREILDRFVTDVSTARYFNQKIFDCNYKINKLLKQYMGE